MDFAVGLLAFCALCAGVAVYRGLVFKRRESRREREAGASMRTTSRMPNIESGSMQWIGAQQLSEWLRTETTVTVIRVVDEDSLEDPGTGIDGEIPVTLTQLEEGLPWMVGQGRIVIYRMGGIPARTVRCLAKITSGKKVYLLLDHAPIQQADRVGSAGRVLE